ncbi:Yip1 domain-containing protein [Giardia muris]|uniref:Protein YIPF n=1 Tax=Giardia muris TaxID=5742 RepID=A0A4Z1SLY8_GIAMU|nr:Yip1 domain-containing protein [Giardia muris]|eukprot:TNJ26676.1 Yip1 domain-containing protein [Giardia muris]
MADFDPTTYVDSVAPSVGASDPDPKKRGKAKAKPVSSPSQQPPQSPKPQTPQMNDPFATFQMRFDNETKEAVAVEVFKQATRYGPAQSCLRVFDVQYYEQFFQLTTKDFFKHLLQSLLIWKGSFLHDILESPPDMWAPIWISLTLIVALLFGLAVNTFAVYMQTSVYVGFQAAGTSVGLALVIFIPYQWLVPLVFWAACICSGYSTMRYLAIACLYAYSYVPLVPVCLVAGVFSIIGTKNLVGCYIAAGIFALAGLWSYAFYITNIIKYFRREQASRKHILIIGIFFSILHLAAFGGIGALLFLPMTGITYINIPGK